MRRRMLLRMMRTGRMGEMMREMMRETMRETMKRMMKWKRV